MINDLSSLENKIEYSFKNKAILKEALSHSSYTNEKKISGGRCYERLEFLGDSILEFVSSDFLFRKYPDAREGELSRHRAALVCEKALSSCARKLDLGSYLFLGKGEAMGGGAQKDSILCDVIEAVIGAIFIDSDINHATAFINRFIIGDDYTGNYIDYKTHLQELLQTKTGEGLEYVLVSEMGPEHEKEFVVEVRIGGESFGKGIGRNKKEAEQAAACEAMKKVRQEEYKCI